jgi:hypothetical protein
MIYSGIIYKEEQNPPVWFYLIFIGWLPIFLIFALKNPDEIKNSDIIFLVVVLALISELLVIGLIGKLTIIVRWDKILIQVGFFKLIKREIKKSEIKQVRAIDGFSKMQYGIKVIGRTIAYIFWGKGVVEIELNEKSSNSLLSKLTNFNKIIITSQNPTRLVEAIMSMG